MHRHGYGRLRPAEGLSRPSKRTRNRPAPRCTTATSKRASDVGAQTSIAGAMTRRGGAVQERRSVLGGVTDRVAEARRARDRPQTRVSTTRVRLPEGIRDPGRRAARRPSAPPERDDAACRRPARASPPPKRWARDAARPGRGPAGAAPWNDPLRSDLPVRTGGTLSCASSPLQRIRIRRATCGGATSPPRCVLRLSQPLDALLPPNPIRACSIPVTLLGFRPFRGFPPLAAAASRLDMPLLTFSPRAEPPSGV